MKTLKYIVLSLLVSASAIAKENNVKLNSVTLSSGKTKVQSHQAINRSDRLHVLINGGMHGNERLSPEFVNWLMDRYKNGRSKPS